MTKDEDGPTYTAEQVSQGQTILRTSGRKLVFFGGLLLFVILAIVLAWHGRT